MGTFANIRASIRLASRNRGIVKDLVRKGVSVAADHGDTIRQLARDHASGEAVSRLCNECITVSQEVIHLEIARIGWMQPYLQKLTCSVDGITLNLQCKRYGCLLAARIRLRVDTLMLTTDKQAVRLHVVEEEYVGLNLMGKVLLRLCMIVINDPLSYILQESLPARGLEMDNANRVISIDLGGIKTVQRLLEPMRAQWPGLIPLGLIGVDGCDHVAGGIIVRIRAFSGMTLRRKH